ncbi:type VII secretion protein EccE [Streptomyces sp. DSM 44917]|uniref:Type VII secretion protein EccE n=1 Tax=Streptomyces boetiae TaxID=3075541 RepID=A0ABU2L2Z7_9ACTN|nr:type VII secretion protein EccE [Streptomyces sp. DSM 44917]MDT0305683.1 type VII secretion protein EccE [Streptomyces sp. DSM 44917]
MTPPTSLSGGVPGAAAPVQAGPGGAAGRRRARRGAPEPERAPRARAFGRGRVVAVEAGLGGVAAGAAWQGAWGWTLAGAGAAVVAGALARVDRRLTAVAEDAPGAAPPGSGLGLVHALLPALDVVETPDRNGPPLGVLSDGRGHAAVLAFPGGTLPPLPAGLIGRWLDEDPARPAAAQLLVEQFGVPPWDFHYRYAPTVAYRQLPTGGRPVAVRAFLVVRHEPFEAPEAAARRGGGAAGARAAVAAATGRLRARLRAAGAPTTPLGADALRELLRQAGDASGAGRALPGGWAGSAATHCTLGARVSTREEWSRLLAALAACAADRAVAAATLTREGRSLRVRTAVRVVSTLAQHAAGERDRLAASGAAGPPVPDQAAGLLATLPVAYPPHTLAQATGFTTPPAARVRATPAPAVHPTGAAR